MLYLHQWIRLNELYKLMKSIIKISEFLFEILGKPKIIKKNSEERILIKLQCVMHQWIRLDESYKQMKSFFFQSQISFWNFGRKSKNIQT